MAAFNKLPERANEPEAKHGKWWEPKPSAAGSAGAQSAAGSAGAQSAAGSAGDLPDTMIDDMWSHLDEANKNLDLEQEAGSPFPSAQRSPSPAQQVTPIVVRNRADDAQHAARDEQHDMPMEPHRQHSAGAGVQQHGMDMEHDRQQAADPPPEQQQAAGAGVQQHGMDMEHDRQQAADPLPEPQQAAGVEGVQAEVADDKQAGEEEAAPGPEEAPAPEEAAAAASAPSTPGKEEAPAQPEPAPQEPEVRAPEQDKLDRSQQILVLNWLGRRATAKRGTPASKQEAANAKELYMTLTNAQKVMFFDAWKKQKDDSEAPLSWVATFDETLQKSNKNSSAWYKDYATRGKVRVMLMTFMTCSSFCQRDSCSCHSLKHGACCQLMT